MSHDLIIGHGTTIVDPAGGSVAVLGGTTVLDVDVTMLRPAGQPYHGELQYLSLLRELVDKAEESGVREDRTGVGTYSVFGRQIRFDLGHGFPLLTTKRVFWKGVKAELLWMLAGDTNANTLIDQGVHIWDEWAKEDGDLGPVYGAQWRAWPAYKPVFSENFAVYGSDGESIPLTHQTLPVDQISTLIQNLKDKPNDRGHVVSAWNAAQLGDMRLRPCHCLFQFYVDDGKLSCQLYQRSADIFLGVPFNIASYALLTHMIAREVGLEVGEFVHTFGDLHLYSNHLEQAKEQLRRTPRPFPTVQIYDGAGSIFEVLSTDIGLHDYNPHDTIKAEVAV